MFWPVQQLCGVIRVFGTSTSACLRSIGAIISPATALADTVDVTLMRMGLLENTESAPEQESSRRSTTTLSSIKKGLIVWMDRQMMNAILAIAATIWSGLCYWILFVTAFILPLAAAISFPVVCTMVTGLTALRVMVAVKDATTSFIGEIQGIAKARFFQKLDPYLLSWKAGIIDWADVNIPRHANQVRYLMGELPRGQSLPTIDEEEETGEAGEELVGNADEANDNLPTHLAITTKTANADGKRADSGNTVDISVRTV